MENWWKTFFDSDYICLWGGRTSEERTNVQAQGIWELLDLHEGSYVLDAPCGFGRLSLPIAKMGAKVVGADQSQELITRAEENRGGLPTERLWYLRHDLREPLAETGFDAAFNVYSSIGYGADEDDLAVFKNIHSALRPGGLLLVDTMHRDAVAAFISRGAKPGERLPDGTLFVEEPVFDAISGRMNTTWYWSGPSGRGSKSASLRIYTATELVKLLNAAGFCFISAHRGCSVNEFKAHGPEMGGRLAILCERA